MTKQKKNKKLVIKVGTNVLTKENGHLDITTISHLVDQIAELKQKGISVILVSSGAVGAGKGIVQLSRAHNKVVQRQVFSAVGQVRLMNIYTSLLKEYGLHCAQVLTTKEDFRDRMHYLNMKHCFQALLRDNIIPVVNENDVVSVSELMFTDNDELAGLIAAMVNADALILLTNVDGVYDGPPEKEGSRLLKEIDPDDRQVLGFIAPTRSSFGRGGMLTKLRIAQKAAKLGISTYIGNGKRQATLGNIFEENFSGTVFKAKTQVSNVKKWIAFNEAEKKGLVFVNEGAEKVLLSDKKISSLLPIGITKIEGAFEKGDIIQIANEKTKIIGWGIAQYNAAKAKTFIGCKGKKPLIHYDYLFIESTH